MSTTEVQEKVRQFIASTILLGQDEGLNADTPLLEWGIINSMEMKAMMRFLEAEFQVAVKPQDVAADNFRDIRAITELVQRIRARDDRSLTTT